MKKSRVMLLAVIAMVLIIGVATVVFVSCNKKNDSTTTTTNDGPVHEHISSDWIVDKEATYDEEGKKHRECVECGAILEETNIPVLKTASEGLEFALNEDGESYSVIGIGTCSNGDVVIPSIYNDLPVTNIGEFAFCEVDIETEELLPSFLTSVVIPDSVTNIGMGAFGYCLTLQSVTMGNSVETIEYGAFCGCISLTSIEIPNSVTSIGEYAFGECDSLTDVYYTGDIEGWLGIYFEGGSGPCCCGANLYFNEKLVTEVIIPDYVTSISEGIFSGCTSLTSVIIPDSVTSISEGAFSRCTSLTSVTIPDCVTSIGDGAFYGCDSLIEVCNKSSLNIIAGESDNGYVGYYAKHIITDESQSALKYVGDYVFYDDGTDVYFVKYIGDDTEITLPEYDNGKEYEIYQYAFYENNKIVSIKIPDSVTSIGDRAFEDCTSLTNITIPDSVTSIGNWAFEDCPIQYAVIPANAISEISKEHLNIVTITSGEVSYGAFENCELLITVTIGDSVTSIGRYAFNSCDSLMSVTIGDAVTSIGEYAFNSCDSLIEVCNKSSLNITAGSIDYGEVGRYAKHIITDESQSALKYVGDYVFYDDGTDVYFVKYFGNDTEITLPEYNGGKEYEIWRSAFDNCTSLSSIIIPDFVTSIGSSAFNNCTSLSSITILDSVTSIGWGAFSSCISLTSITIPNSVTSIGEWAFYGCTSLTTITIPDLVTSIGNYAFSGCDSLTSVIIGDSVTSIGNYAFSGCDSLTSVIIGESVANISGSAFDDCPLLTSIDADENNTYYKSIGGNLYSKDGTTLIMYAIGKQDTSFTIPDSVTSIGNGAFYGCTSLISVTIPNSVASIGDSAFRFCTSLTSVTIGDAVTSIGRYAFNSCDSLIEVCNKSSLNIIAGSTGDGFVGCYAKHIIADESQSALKYVGDYVFYDDGTDVYFVKYFGDDTEIILPEYDGGREYGIWQYAFYKNDKITKVIIPDSVTSIDKGAFSCCYSLTSVTIGNSVTSILTGGLSGESSAFYGCTSLIEVCNKSSLNIIAGSTSNGYVGCYAKYIITDESKSYLKYVGDYVFYDDGTEVYLVKYLGDYKEITLPEYDGGKEYGIWKYAFCLNEKIIRVTISDSVTSIGSYAFSDCTALTSINFEGSIEQWNYIEKEYDWKVHVPAIEVICINGTVSLK